MQTTARAIRTTKALSTILTCLKSGLLAALIAGLAIALVGGGYRYAQQRTNSAASQSDKLAVAAFQGRHSGEAVSVSKVTTLNRAWQWEYADAKGQEYRDTITGSLWQTDVKITPDKAKPEVFQWVPIQTLQALNATATDAKP